MEISSIPFLNQEEYSYFYSFFQEFDTNNTAIDDIQTNKRRKINETTTGDSSSLKEILDTISFMDEQEIPDFDFQMPNLDFGSEMAEPERGRIRKTPPPKFDATVTEEWSSSQGGGGGGGGGGPQRRLWVKERSKGWWDYYNSDECPDEEFKKAFRMSKSTFNMICDELDAAVTKKDTMLRMAIPVRQRVAVCLYRLATGDPLRTVSSRFGLGISTCHKLVLEVCAAIRNVLMPKFLQWPDDERLEEIQTEFQSISGISNISGSIYTTHISIIAPKVTPAAYFNKKHTERNQKPSYSTTVQGVVDSRGVFTDICIGYPGSMSDDKILEKSAISQRFNIGYLKNIWIVGNSGYPLLDWLLVPYTHQHHTWSQHSFNEKIGDVQKTAKDAFMRLKGRWTCLQKRTEVKLQDLPVVLGACCVLHNICEMNGEAMDPDLSFDLFDDEIVVAENGGGKSGNAVQTRDTIAHNLLHCSNGGSGFR
ncbi:protein ANTAGONIST OF LIKE HETEROCHROMATIN PROTEIN 1-like [Cynara cardunculus var. scolymus]|uniref:Harbinger transposase-derived nuclease n=1 Tax=Cynara cardunculus var. scolymus TaxID=59895 RepID=A0A103XNH4_CYNCS|nr:protein ANTAGONIST OF LIKE HETEROCHROMATIN PROTEIN 1-like [Cynara cardunculus var. scolymus]KVH93992.1 Harbinger transposase-derived nuclease [Cynara cardunculus var. scolymus]